MILTSFIICYVIFCYLIYLFPICFKAKIALVFLCLTLKTLPNAPYPNPYITSKSWVQASLSIRPCTVGEKNNILSLT